MRGHKHEARPGVWRFHVYAGRDPKTGRKRQVTKTFRGTATEAEEALGRFVVEVRDGRHAHPTGSLGDLLERWMGVASLAPATRVDYWSVIRNHILPTLGMREVSRLRASDLDQLYAQLSETLKPARVRRVHNVLSKALAQAVRWREIAQNVARDASPPSVSKKEIDPPSPAELVKLLEVARESYPGLVAYVYACAATGARRAEVCALQWRDVDLEERTVVIRQAVVLVPGKILIEPTKQRRARRIALDAATAMVLRSHRATCQEAALGWGMAFNDEAFVFHREGDNRIPWRPDVVSHQFARLRDSAGLPRLTIRQLRHFVATQLLGEGHDVVTVAGRLGHSKPSTTTDIYGHFQPVKDRDAANTLGRLLSG